MDDRKENLLNELKRLKALATNNHYRFSMFVKEKQLLSEKSKKILLPALTIFYMTDKDETKAFFLIIQFLDESMNTRRAERWFDKFVNSPLYNNLDCSDKKTHYRFGTTVKLKFSDHDYNNDEKTADTLLKLCQLFSGRKDIEIDVSFNLCLDHNKKILDYAIKLETSDFQNYSFAKILDSILQDIQFTGNSLALEIYKDEDNEEPIQTIIINFDSTYEFYSLYNHSSRLCNHELEDLFARLRNFESLEYLNQLDMYDNSIVASLHFNLSQVPFYIGLICNYLTILYPEIDFNCIHTEIIDLSKIK